VIVAMIIAGTRSTKIGKNRKRSYRLEGDYRVIPFTKETRAIFDQQFEAFRKKFGRIPSPEDPIFFNPDADTPQLLSEEKIREYKEHIAEVALKAGIDPAIAYAMRKTGRIVTETNMQYLTDEELQEWYDAVEEYEHMEKGKKS
jgi:hypothetical protein